MYHLKKLLSDTTMAPSTSSQPMYQKDERVLCFHHELLYEAKVLDHKMKDPNDKKDGYSYRVHYKGWKNTYVSLFCFNPLEMLGLPLCQASSLPS